MTPKISYLNKVQYSDDSIIDLCSDTKTREQGFRQLMSKYQERLYWHVRRMVKSHEDADDVLQNTFIKVYRNLDKYRSEAKLYTWLYRIATNESLNHFRKIERNKSVLLDDNNPAIYSLKSDDYFDGNDAQKKLAAAIDSLPEKQKIVFNLRYYDEMTYKDMSQVLSTSEGALKASYHIAVKKIEKIITNET